MRGMQRYRCLMQHAPQQPVVEVGSQKVSELPSDQDQRVLDSRCRPVQHCAAGAAHEHKECWHCSFAHSLHMGGTYLLPFICCLAQL